MSLLDSMNLVGSALTAERFRIDVALQNLACQNITADPATGEEPYRRRQVVFQERAVSFQDALKEESARVKGGGVRVTQVVESQRDFIPVYDPDHPHANEDGYVELPNVDLVKEVADAMAASQAYSADVTAFNLLKNVVSSALEIGR